MYIYIEIERERERERERKKEKSMDFGSRRCIVWLTVHDSSSSAHILVSSSSCFPFFFKKKEDKGQVNSSKIKTESSTISAVAPALVLFSSSVDGLEKLGFPE